MKTLISAVCLFALSGLAMAGCPGGGAGTLYVDRDAATTNGTGLSWDEAKRTVQAPLALAQASPGTYSEIRIADGTYYANEGTAVTFQLVSGVMLVGNFQGQSASTGFEDCAGDGTTLTGPVYHIVSGQDLGIGSGLRDLTVAGGPTSRPDDDLVPGALLTCTDSTLTVNKVEFNSGVTDAGGGACGLIGTTATFECCLFQKNDADADDADPMNPVFGRGGHVWIGDSSENVSIVSFSATKFYYNIDDGRRCQSGAAIYFNSETDGKLVIRDGCRFEATTSQDSERGGMIHAVGGTVEISNSVVNSTGVINSDDLASIAIGIDGGCNAKIVSCIINGGGSDAKCGIGIDAASSASITNCILDGAPATENVIDAIRVEGYLELTNCTVREWTGAAVLSLDSGTGTICNTICWLNGEQGNEGATDDIVGATDFAVTHCVIQQTIDGSWTACCNTDPELDGDLRPSVCSNANGKGTLSCLPNDDLDVDFDTVTAEQLPLDCPKFVNDTECTNRLITDAEPRIKGTLDIGARETESDYPSVDWNADGIVDFFDYLDFVADFDNNNGDFNGDTVTDFFDYLDFVAAFAPCST